MGCHNSFEKGRVTLSQTTIIELQYRVLNSQATNGLGGSYTWGDEEIYASVIVTKIGL